METKINKFCRTCVRYDAPTQKLSELFAEKHQQSVLNYLQASEDRLPQGVCVDCAETLKKFEKFREKALKAKDYLEELIPEDVFDSEAELPLNVYTDDCNKTNVLQSLLQSEAVPLPIEDVKEQLDISCMLKNPIKRRRKKKRIATEKNRCIFCLVGPAKQPLFETKEDLIEHISVVHYDKDRPYNCPYCDLTYESESSGLAHIAKVHRKRSVQCETCNKTISGGKGKLRVHNERHHIIGDYKCDICGKVFENSSLFCFKYHKRVHHTEKLFKCQYCEKNFIRQDNLQAHLVTHTKKGTFVCNHCGKSTKNKLQLRLHLYSVHSEGEPPVGMKKSKSAPPRRHSAYSLFKCPLCPRKFRVEHAFNKHTAMHTRTERVYPCNECSSTFKWRSSLSFHKKAKHSTEQPFKCDHCIKTFANKNAFKVHIKTHQVTERKFECTVCKRKYKFEKSLHNHQLRHAETEQSCKECGKSFIKHAQLIEHVNRYHKILKKESDKTEPNKLNSRSQAKLKIKKEKGKS